MRAQPLKRLVHATLALLVLDLVQERENKCTQQSDGTRASRIPPRGARTAEGFVPLIKDVPGLVAYHFADAGGGVMISMSVYEDQSGAEESSKQRANGMPRTSPS